MGDITAKLREILAEAEAGRVSHFAFHYSSGEDDHWGFINVSPKGALVIPAQLSALALNNQDGTE